MYVGKAGAGAVPGSYLLIQVLFAFINNRRTNKLGLVILIVSVLVCSTLPVQVIRKEIPMMSNDYSECEYTVIFPNSYCH